MAGARVAHKSKEVLHGLAKLASDAFLGKNKTPLNDSITKIAKQEGLNSNQIEIVVAEANRDTWQRTFNEDKKASYDFPIADAPVIIEGLQLKNEGNVIKEAAMDYLTPPTKNHHGLDKHASATINLSTLDSEVAERRKTRLELEKRAAKMVQAKEEIERRIYDTKSSRELFERDFVKQARQLIMEEPFSQRGAALEKIAEFVRSALEDDLTLGQSLMGKLAHVVKHQGLVKEADLKAPDQYISKKLPAKVINGRHILYVTLKTIKDKSASLYDLDRQYKLVDDSLPLVREKIRAL
jgi:hypothetical protein